MNNKSLNKSGQNSLSLRSVPVSHLVTLFPQALQLKLKSRLAEGLLY